MYSSDNGGFDTERGNYVELKFICSKCGYEKTVPLYTPHNLMVKVSK